MRCATRPLPRGGRNASAVRRRRRGAARPRSSANPSSASPPTCCPRSPKARGADAMRIVVSGAAGRLAAALLPEAVRERRRDSRDRHRPCPSRSFRHAKFAASHRRNPRDAAHELRCAMRRRLVHLAFELLRGRLPLRGNVGATMSTGSERVSRRGGGYRTFLESCMYRPPQCTGSGRQCGRRCAARAMAAFSVRVPEGRARDAGLRVRCRKPWCCGRPSSSVRTLCRFCGSSSAHLFYLRLPDPQPRLQCVHEDDVADAIVAALAARVRGRVQSRRPAKLHPA